MSARPDPVPAERYSDEYFRVGVGGGEFFAAFGPQVLKPQLAHAARRARLASGMRVLDIGCGRGELLYHVRKLGGEAVGTDFAGPALKIAGKVSGCPVLRCDAKELPFKDASFDRVFLIGVIDHLHDWELERCFAEVGRVLKPGGLAAVHTCTNRLYYKNLTYGLRRALCRVLGLKSPAAPRSTEDRELHVNEHSYGDLVRFFRRINWTCEAELIPNYKLKLGELYGTPLPGGLPMTPVPRWRAALYFGLLFHWPLNRILARELFALVRPKADA